MSLHLYDDRDLFPPPIGGDEGPGGPGDSDPYAPEDYPITTWVIIDGIKAPCTKEDLGAGQPTVLDGLSFSWGRESIIDQPDINTCSFTIREQVAPDAVTTTDMIHVGSQVEVWSQADVPVTDAEVMRQTDFTGYSTSLPDTAWAVVDGDQPDQPPPIQKQHGRTGPWFLHRDRFDPWTTSIVFGPDQFVLDAEAQPNAWDLIPRLLPGQTWTLQVMVWVPPRTTATLIGQAYTGPHKTDAAGACTITETGQPDETITAAGDPQIMVDGGGWVTLTGTVRLPDTLTDPAGYWIAPGIRLDPLPSPIQWDDPAVADWTWDDQVLRWIDLQRAGIYKISLLTAEATVRPVLVWSGEVTTLTLGAVGYKAISTAVVASDLSSILQNVKVGDDPWPSETVQQRADKIMALIPTSPPLVIDPGLQNTLVSYRDVDAQAPLGLLQDLAQTAGGVLWITAHATQGAYLWIEDPRNRESVRRFAIDDQGAVYITNDAGDTVTGVAVLSANDVLRDPVQWTQDVSQVITQVSVSWLEQIPPAEGEQTTTEDRTEVVQDTQARIDRYGIRDVSVQTELVSVTDAQQLAARILALSTGTGWKFDGLQLDTILLCRDIATVAYPARLTTVLDLLDATTRIGYAVTLIDMPEWTPAGAVRSVYIDGGTYTWADHRWQLELTATPSAGQGQSATWADFAGTGVTWDDFRPNRIRWTDAYGTAGPIVQDQLQGAQ